jgi:c-di-GMP-related signal transduction protein
MTFPDTIPFDPSRPTLPKPARDAWFASLAAPEDVAADNPFACFDYQEIVGEDGRVFGHDLSVSDDDSPWPHASTSEASLPAKALSHALLDASVAGFATSGSLFLDLGESALMGPVADVLTARIGVINLTGAVAADARLLMRVARLHARGQRFCIDGLRDPSDPRWHFAPYSDYIKLDASAPPDQLAPLAAKAAERHLAVIGKRVDSMDAHRRLCKLGVTQFQGLFVSSLVTRPLLTLPGCDAEVLVQLQRLLRDRASPQAVAEAAAKDPALMMRLLLLHERYAPQAAGAPEQLAGLMVALGVNVLGGWLQLLRSAACHAQGADWVRSVRQQTLRYRQHLIGVGGQRPEAVDMALWHFQRRLCSARHYLKTVNHPV